MLRVLSAIVFLILFIMFLVFWMQNLGAFTMPVEIKYNLFLKINPIEMELWALLLIMLVMGITMTFFLEMVGWLKTRSKIVQQNRKIRSLEKELQEYRTRDTKTTPADDSSGEPEKITK